MNARTISLLEKYISKTLTADEERELIEIANSSPEERAEILQVIRIRKAENGLKFARTVNLVDSWENVIAKINRKRRVRWSMIGAAASIAIILSVGFSFNLAMPDNQPKTLAEITDVFPNNKAHLWIPGTESLELSADGTGIYRDFNGTPILELKGGKLYQRKLSKSGKEGVRYATIKVEKGSIINFTMHDGTEVILGSGSSLTYPTNSYSRSVKLQGEAYFDVAHDPQHPFSVSCANNLKVTVLGTKFNVSAYPNAEGYVTLESGRVALSSKAESLTLAPGQQATIAQNGHISVSEVDTQIYTSWSQGIYEFENTSLKDIATTLSLWYGVKIQFASSELENREFTGVLFRHKKLSYTLNLIRNLTGISIVKDGENILIKE